MTVGTDTYVSLDEADAYANNYYAFGSTELENWFQLLPVQREAMLTDAYREICLIPLPSGRNTVAQAVKYAQIELAIWLSDTEKRKEENARMELNHQGVTSFSLGDLSESYRNGMSEPAASRCSKCRVLLMPYMSGGFEIC